MTIASMEEVDQFWFVDHDEEDWFFNKTATFDQEIRQRFFDTWDAGRQGLLHPWRETFKGRMMEIIVLDQFSRNLWRGDARSYSQDGMAMILSQHLIKMPEFKKLSHKEQHLMLLPLVHQESKGIHQEILPIYQAMNNWEYEKREVKHKKIIDRFGRYPHRNEILGRLSTLEEVAYLKENGPLG